LARIGEEFREARLAAGLTQRQVGAAAGISHAQVSRIELGRAPNVPFVTLAVIAAVLGLDLPLRTFVSGDPIATSRSSRCSLGSAPSSRIT